MYKTFREILNKIAREFETPWKTLLILRNNDTDKTIRILNDHSERVVQLIKRVDALFSQPLVHQKYPPNSKFLNTDYHNTHITQVIK